MSTTLERVKPSEAFREKALVRYRGIIHDLVAPSPSDGTDPIDSADGHIPRQSKDSALTAFAQLAAIRLNGSRALVSLIDSKWQYILAESTRSLSLQADAHGRAYDSLWLGSATISRCKGICGLALEHALNISSSTPPVRKEQEDQSDILVVSDLKEDPRTSSASFVASNPGLRFYAGAPIRTTDGAIIGTLCIFDNRPRSGLNEEEEYILRDISKTITQHLDSLRINYAHARTNRLLTGLESFVDGLANSRTNKQAAANHAADLPQSSDQLAAQDVAAESKEPSPWDKGPTKASSNQRDDSPQHLWDLAMPAGSKPMFSRAANIMRQSGDYDGCAIFYVPTARKAQASRNNLRTGRTQQTSEETDLSHSDSSSSSERMEDISDIKSSLHVDQLSPRSVCPLLSYSLAPTHANRGKASPFSRFKRRDLEKLLGKSPRPRTFTLNKSGEILPGDSSSSSSGFDQSDSSNVPNGDVWGDGADKSRLQAKLLLQQVKALKKIDSNALSYVCLPLWDFERQRWLAFCVCWTSSPSRHLKFDGDLGFLRVFANSIAVSLSHIDAIASNRSKGAFVSSISHELRSPLHGILSATNFLRDGDMSRFEREMIGVISSCGRTLLDTLDHVMDFAKISSAVPKQHQRTPTETILDPTPQPANRELGSALSSRVNLANLIEEVVEAVLMGYSVQHDFLYAEDDEWVSMSKPINHHLTAPPLPRSRSMVNTRGRIRIVLDIPYRENWHVYTQPGAWRRIIMNVFGNSLKYTNSGLIMVGASFSSPSESTLSVRLNVLDTGRGIAKHYLDTRLYTAFSQEDQLSSGTGLGLAIVKQVIDSLNGDIEFKSIQGKGTSIAIDLAVPIADTVPPLFDTSELGPDLLDRLKGRNVYILEDITAESTSSNQTSVEAERELLDAFSSMLKVWFGIQVSTGSTWPANGPDLVILLKPWLKYFEMNASDDIFRQPILLVAYDALEMAVLRSDARIARLDAIIEVTSQPLGPYKVARIFKQCLDRYDQLLFANSRPASTVPSFSKSPSNLSLVRSATPQDHFSPPPPTESRAKSADLYRDPFVLIVDDNPLNLRLLSVYIDRQSLRYHEAVNGQEAVDIFRAAKGSVRCILMDISMPVLDGIAATRLIRECEQREQLPRTLVVALTGLTSAASRSEAQEAGMDDFLTKPISFSQLGTILGEVKGL